MAVITAAAGGGNWNVGGSWVGGVSPGSADDALLTVTSGNITIPTATTVACRSLDCTGYTGTFTFASGTANLEVGDASGGACKFVAGMTLTLTGVGTITFLATTASTTYDLTTGGKTMPNLTVAAGSSTTIRFADNVATNFLTFTSGILNTNSKTATISQFVSTGSTSRTLTLGSSAITVSGWNFAGASNLTVTANTATATHTTSLTTFAGGGIDYNGMTVVLSAISTVTISGANTFGALTRNATAINSALILAANQTITGALTLTGNAAANRIWIQSDTPGTARTITANGTITASRADFEDITGAGSASWNLSGITEGAGDCGGNSGITFTTATTAYGVVAGNWSATATWSTSSGGGGGAPVPLPQDTVVLDASSAAGTYTMNMQRAGKDITCTGFTRTLSFASSATQRYIFGSLTLGSGMTFSATGNITLAGRGSHTLMMATKAFTAAASRGVTIGRFGGTYTLADDADFGSVAGDGLSTAGGGTLDAAGFNVSAWLFTHGTATLTMGAGTWTAVGTGVITAWTAVAGTTVNAATSTIAISAASASTRTFAGGGKTYGSLTYTVAGSTGQLSITGSNTFATINFSDASNARTLAFTAGTTTTITGSFNVFGTAGLLMTITSVTAANHTLTKTSGQVSGNYLSISRSQAGGGANWYASNSTDRGNNTGWIFLEQSIFTTQTPSLADFSSGANVYTLGTMFTSTVPGLVRGIRWFTATPGVNEPGVTAALYSFTTDTTGVQLATVTIGSLPAGQWIQALFATPVPIASGTRYVACVGVTTHFALTTSAFAAAGITNGYLTAPIDAVGAHNGKFKIFATLTYPDSVSSATNYFVDVVFSPAPQHSPIPRVIGTPVPAAVRAANW